MKQPKILVIGACGQLGTELTVALRQKFGVNQVIAADRYPKVAGDAPYAQLDVLNFGQLADFVRKEEITEIYLLAAILSAVGEQNIDAAWEINITGLLNVLKIAAAQQLDKIFWPSSIAVFGHGTPKHRVPQYTLTEPNTIYGISKRSGEYLCQYYFDHFGVDVRSLRFPGLVSWATQAGGGTTDYAVDIFHQALEKKSYTCFLNEDTCLPMMYMPDAVRAAMELMGASREQIKIRTAYNISALSFSPCDIAFLITKQVPGFRIKYEADFRQAIANSWPASIDDMPANRDWGWEPQYNLAMMVDDMIRALRPIKETERVLALQRLPEDNYVYTRYED